MTRTERLLTLIQILRRNRHPITGRRLAEEMSVSLRTVYRDIETLIAQGAPIEGEAGIGFVLRSGFLLPPLMFRDTEIEALVLGARWVALQSDRSLATAAQDVVAKIINVVPERLKEQVEYAGLYAVPAKDVAQDVVDSAILRDAIRQERKLRIVYRDKQGRSTRRVICPLALGFYEQVRVLVAWCDTRRGFRHFRTDRIAAAESTDGTFPRRRRILFREWRAHECLLESTF